MCILTISVRKLCTFSPLSATSTLRRPMSSFVPEPSRFDCRSSGRSTADLPIQVGSLECVHVKQDDFGHAHAAQRERNALAETTWNESQTLQTRLQVEVRACSQNERDGLFDQALVEAHHDALTIECIAGNFLVRGWRRLGFRTDVARVFKILARVQNDGGRLQEFHIEPNASVRFATFFVSESCDICLQQFRWN